MVQVRGNVAPAVPDVHEADLEGTLCEQRHEEKEPCQGVLMKHEKNINIVLIIFVVLAVIFGIRSSVQHYNSGRLSDQLRIELNDAADTNRRLTEKIGQCRIIITDLRTTTETNITTARQAIEVLEELRVQVQELEDCLQGDGAGYDYSYWDSYLGID